MATYDQTSGWGSLQNTQFDVGNTVPSLRFPDASDASSIYSPYQMSGQSAPVSTPGAPDLIPNNTYSGTSSPTSFSKLATGLAPAVASGVSLASSLAKPASDASKLLGGLGKANPYIAAGSLALGAIETIIAARKLKQLDRQKPAGYQITPEEQEMYQRSKDMASYGFSQQQKDAYLGEMRRQSNIGFQRAKTMAGGSLGSALSAATSRQDMSQFALNDAQLQAAKESKFAQAAMNVSRKRDMMAQQATSEYGQKQQQWGRALQSGLGQLGSVANLMSATTYKG